MTLLVLFTAAVALTPEEAVQRASAAHALLAAQSARVEAAQSLATQAGLRPNPRLFLQSENTRVSRAASPFHYSSDTDNFAYVSQVFERGGKRERRAELASEAVVRRKFELSLRRSDLAKRVLVAYWSVVGAEKTRDLLNSNLASFEQTVQYHRDRVREGALAEADLIRMELEKGQYEVAYRNAAQDAVRLRLDLLREIADPSLAADVALHAALSAPDAPADTAEPLKLDTDRADLRLGAQIVAQASASIRLEKANSKPDPEVLAGYKRTSGYNTLVAGVQINLPVRNRNQGAIGAAMAEKRAAELELQAASQLARVEVRAARSDLEQKLRLLRDEIPRIQTKAGETVRIARAVYREGAGDLLRLLDAERGALQAELLYVRTLVESRLASIQLQSAMGMLP